MDLCHTIFKLKPVVLPVSLRTPVFYFLNESNLCNHLSVIHKSLFFLTDNGKFYVASMKDLHQILSLSEYLIILYHLTDYYYFITP
jgi:hypothetical protein